MVLSARANVLLSEFLGIVGRTRARLTAAPGPWEGEAKCLEDHDDGSGSERYATECLEEEENKKGKEKENDQGCQLLVMK